VVNELVLKNEMQVLITGSNGFIGKNLLVSLGESSEYDVSCFNRGDRLDLLTELVNKADVIIHLAGENRPKNDSDFKKVNSQLTKKLCSVVKLSGRKPLVILASSTQANSDNLYGRSKREAEKFVEELSINCDIPSVIYRFPGVFGKWCRPNYNSVVATFCHNIANNLSIIINDPLSNLKLVYIDDVVKAIINDINSIKNGLYWKEVWPEYSITLKQLADQIQEFKNSRISLFIDKVGSGISRALYATYMSYLSPDIFAYNLTQHIDKRGKFVEIIKTSDSGQFSFFTALPGITRGGHYHHSKTEKFIVVRGQARFGFRNIVTGEKLEIMASDDQPRVVETIPGWAHDITNIGEDYMIVMLWANEIFDSNNPDTIGCEV
jgi:UDP-2-acetamido-2,6-beta-L-arabino-hexul-4-ose reductase